jgi:hypothetical protein
MLRWRARWAAAGLALLLLCAPNSSGVVGASAVDSGGKPPRSASAPASVDFIDLDGDTVVAPFRWQVS